MTVWYAGHISSEDTNIFMQDIPVIHTEKQVPIGRTNTIVSPDDGQIAV
jgi:hypothetical protein